MAGVIEIWRRERAADLPVRFTVGQAPMYANGDHVPDGPIVKNIDYRELNTLGTKRYHEPLFCISFEESFVQRLVPAGDVVDIAYETKKAEEPKTPQLEI